MPRLSNRPTSLAVACDQRVTGSLVYSNLTIRTAGDSGLTPETAARRLASLYFSELPCTSAGLFAAGTRRDSRGEHLALYFRLAPFLPFVIIGSPGEEWAPPQASVSYPITGGLLASRPPAGALIFAAANRDDGSLVLAVRVDGYASRLAGDCTSLWRRTLYSGTQWFVHRMLVSRFLKVAARRMSSPGQA
jgi:hypothetical protein